MLPSQPPPAVVRRETPISASADTLARLPLAEAHAICDAEVDRAVREWRISDATEWQRVKFRLRWMHALRARGVTAEEGA